MATAKGRKQVKATIDEVLYEKLVFWANKKGMSANQFMANAIDLAIQFESGNYELQTLEQQRLNQLVDVIETLSFNVKGLEDMVKYGFDSLLGLTRGDNYLLDREEDGEI